MKGRKLKRKATAPARRRKHDYGEDIQCNKRQCFCLFGHEIGGKLKDARDLDNGLTSSDGYLPRSSTIELKLNSPMIPGLKEWLSFPISEMDETLHLRNSTGDSDSVKQKCDAEFRKGNYGKSCPDCSEEDRSSFKDENANVEVLKPGVKRLSTVREDDSTRAVNSENQGMVGDSLLDSLTVEQIKGHILSLNPHFAETLSNDSSKKRMDHTVEERSCQLCGDKKLSLGPEPKYCSSCASRVKDNANYYISGEENGSGHYICASCYSQSRRTIQILNDKMLIKSRLKRKKNDDKVEESWIQCSSCRGWQHQICGLYNDRKYANGKAEYICLLCRLRNELKYGTTTQLPADNTIFRAKDLPSTKLSDHLEQRLSRRLEQEREERAKIDNKTPADVPGAEDLIVRVVSSVRKKAKAKKLILDMLHDHTYPLEIPYKSKVILFFQKSEGIDVCIFALYVQEFGSECNYPSHRCVYISYLDSVKYFKPDVQTITNEALRTFVFHELLIGYLDYCKQRGFATCYIWSSPPSKGNDYIFNSHPEIQKTPKCNKLRQWYLNMLRKAIKENIVLVLTNLYDQFFICNKGYNNKITTACLPYFDGDYWNHTAEDILIFLQGKSAAEREAKLKRILRNRRQEKTSDINAMDILLMEALGEKIMPMKEDFIIAHLQHICANCNQIIVSKSRWTCNHCNYHVCERCNNGIGIHFTDRDEDHILNKVTNEILARTIDDDPVKDNSILEDRSIFLEFCQKNQYKFDSLRRAKHSSMMILHSLHNNSL